MKNVFVALALIAFTGSFAANSYAASTNNTELVKEKGEKGKKKKKECKKGGGSCCHKKAEA